MTASLDLLAIGFVLAPALIGGCIALAQSKYTYEHPKEPRQEPTISHTWTGAQALHSRKEPTFDQV